MQVHLAADDRSEVLVPPEEVPAGAGGWQQFGQHVHVAARRVEVISQYRAEEAQLADATRATKVRDLVAVYFNGQISYRHVISKRLRMILCN